MEDGNHIRYRGKTMKELGFHLHKDTIKLKMSVTDRFSGYQYSLTDRFRVCCHQRESICEINGDELDNKACNRLVFSVKYGSTELIVLVSSTALSIPKSFNLPLGLWATHPTHICIHLHISH